MKKITTVVTFCLLFAFQWVLANKHATSTKYTSYKGLIMAGYQGSACLKTR